MQKTDALNIIHALNGDKQQTQTFVEKQ